MPENPYSGPEWDRFARDVRNNLISKMESSAVCLSIVTGTVDLKIAVELGAALLLDKPLIVVALRGEPVPERLRRAADRVVEIEGTDDPTATQRLAEAMNEVLFKGGGQ